MRISFIAKITDTTIHEILDSGRECCSEGYQAIFMEISYINQIIEALADRQLFFGKDVGFVWKWGK
jgi:hypothetical protein